jgi:hypothetical protein
MVLMLGVVATLTWASADPVASVKRYATAVSVASLRLIAPSPC